MPNKDHYRVSWQEQCDSGTNQKNDSARGILFGEILQRRKDLFHWTGFNGLFRFFYQIHRVKISKELLPGRLGMSVCTTVCATTV